MVRGAVAVWGGVSPIPTATAVVVGTGTHSIGWFGASEPNCSGPTGCVSVGTGERGGWVPFVISECGEREGGWVSLEI